MVYVKEHADTEEIEIDLMKTTPHWSPDPKELPSMVSPKGLSAEWQWYLHDNIRHFCPNGDKDITCPLPGVPKPGGSQPGTPAARTQQLVTILSHLLPNANAYVAPAGKDTIVAHAQIRTNSHPTIPSIHPIP